MRLSILLLVLILLIPMLVLAQFQPDFGTCRPGYTTIAGMTVPVNCVVVYRQSIAGYLPIGTVIQFDSKLRYGNSSRGLMTGRIIAYQFTWDASNKVTLRYFMEYNRLPDDTWLYNQIGINPDEIIQ